MKRFYQQSLNTGQKFGSYALSIGHKIFFCQFAHMCGQAFWACHPLCVSLQDKIKQGVSLCNMPFMAVVFPLRGAWVYLFAYISHIRRKNALLFAVLLDDLHTGQGLNFKNTAKIFLTKHHK
jgi:hypothetical protein